MPIYCDFIFIRLPLCEIFCAKLLLRMNVKNRMANPKQIFWQPSANHRLGYSKGFVSAFLVASFFSSSLVMHKKHPKSGANKRLLKEGK